MIKARRFFAFSEKDEGVLGYGGAEIHGNIALLRSVVVVEHLRNQGIGAQIVNWIFDWLRQQGCKEVYMLTTTAASFGARRGFEKLDRNKAPKPIRDSRQMTRLCSVTAVLMGRKPRRTI